MRWFTCTPVEFGGGADFFARDSGLLCRGFQALGIDSRAVMPGPAKVLDEPDLIRTDYSKRWPDAERYLGTAERGDAAVAKLHFPGIHPEAARFLAAIVSDDKSRAFLRQKMRYVECLVHFAMGD